MPKCIALLLFITSSLHLSAQFHVKNTAPHNQTITTPSNTDIVITFDQPIAESTLTDTTFRVFGRWSGVKTGSFKLEQENTVIRFSPNEDFFAGEWVTVSLSNQIFSTSDDPLSYGYAFNFWIATAISELAFEEIDRIPIRREGEEHIQSYGAYAGDLNKDGWSDLAIPNEQSNDVRVFYNDGAGNYKDFEIHPLIGGAKPSANEGADFNHDGIIDFAVANTDNGNIHVLMGDESGVFQPAVSYKAQQGVRGLSILDYNVDGYDDIITANRVGNNLSIFENDKTGSFRAAVDIETSGIGETAVSVADANNDGIMDLFVGAFNSREVLLMLGDSLGNWRLTDRQTVAGNPWMLAVGDLNGDGNADVVSVNSYGHSASVIFGDGHGKFTQSIYYSSGVFPLAVDLGDLDGDGDLDMVTSQYSSINWIVYENDGLGNFSYQDTLVANLAGSCAILHDRDQDGDLDITAIDELSDEIFIFDHINTAVNTSLHEKDAFSFSISPNPAREGIRIDIILDRKEDVELKIVNLLGQNVANIYSNNLSAGKHQLNWQGELVDGLYFVVLEDGNTMKSVPLIWME